MNTVTIELKDYDAMKQRIADLEKQVEAKTIIKEVQPDWVRILTAGVAIACLVGFWIWMSRPFL